MWYKALKKDLSDLYRTTRSHDDSLIRQRQEINDLQYTNTKFREEINRLNSHIKMLHEYLKIKIEHTEPSVKLIPIIAKE